MDALEFSTQLAALIKTAQVDLANDDVEAELEMALDLLRDSKPDDDPAAPPTPKGPDC